MNLTNLSGIPWLNETMNKSWDALSSNLCPFDAVASLDYNFHIIFNFATVLMLFLETRYGIQASIGISEKRATMNKKLLLVMMAVFNTIFFLNQFLLFPAFAYLRVVYGV